MSDKLFKAVNVFFNHPGTSVDEFTDNLHEMLAVDPSGSQWRSVGISTIGGEHFVDVQGSGVLLMVLVSERILPASVIKEAMGKRKASIEDREGRKIGRKEYAELKDDVVQELLPKSHIRRKLVPVLVNEKFTFVFTSSAKLCDDVVHFMCDGETYMPPVHVAAIANVPSVLTSVAIEGVDEFEPGCEVVLKGKDKQTIRVKDKDVEAHDVQTLLSTGDYRVSALAMKFVEELSDRPLQFFLNDKLTLSKLQFSGVVPLSKGADEDEIADNLLATSWLVVTQLEPLVDALCKLLCNIPVDEMLNSIFGKAATTASDPDDDDEL